MIRQPRKAVPILTLLIVLLATMLPVPRAQAQAGDTVPMISLLLELEAPSAGEAYLALLEQASPEGVGAAGASAAAVTQATAAAQAQLALVESEQLVLSAALAEMGVVTLYRAQRVYNAIGVMAPADGVNELAALPGVRAVRPLLAKQADNSISVPFLGAPGLWGGGAGFPLTGKEIRIGIIDTGIDYIHTDFGGSGKGYERNDTTRIDDIDAFPSVKVVDGFDFVGDDYNASPGSGAFQPIPRPDLDPMDCYGHGTHVAGTAAGYGVTTTGATYLGPFDGLTPVASMRIGPGVAPEADLIALKVFGCAGSSLIVDLAIEWSVDPNQDGDFSDHLDVINLSLGSPFGDSDDSTSIAADRAAQLGIIVVASAGNSGDVLYVAGSPGSASYAISVAATTANRSYGGLDAPVSDTLAAFSSRGPRRDGTLKPDLAAPGENVTSAHSGTGYGALSLSGTSMAAPHVAGAMALLRQFHPTWRVDELKALLMNTAMPVIQAVTIASEEPATPARIGAGRIDLTAAATSMVVALNGDDPGVVNLSFGAPDVLGTFSAVHNLRVRNLGATVQHFNLTYVPSKDLDGVDIVAPPTVTVQANGTTVLPVRFEANAAAMRNNRSVPANAADANLTAWQSEESGLIWLWPTPSTFSTPLPVEGAQDVRAHFVLDVNSRTLSYLLPPVSALDVPPTTYTLRRGAPGVVSASDAYTLGVRTDSAQGTLAISGTLVLSPSDMALLAGGALVLHAQPDASSDSTPADPTSSGGIFDLRITADVPVLKVPVYAAPRPVAEMRAARPLLDFGTGEASTQVLGLTGETLTFTQTPTTTRPLVSVLELVARSPQAPAAQEPPTPATADIMYVGVASDFPAVANKADARIFFGIVTYAPWATPNEVQFSFYVDTNDDKVSDYRVYNSTTFALDGYGRRADTFVTGIDNFGVGTRAIGDPVNMLAPGDVQTALLNSNVMVLSVPASKLGLSAARPAFSLRVNSTPLNADSPVAGDSVDVVRYNMAAPGLNLTSGQVGSPIFTDEPATQLTIGFSLVPYATSDALGILLLHHHNGSDMRAETVAVNYRWPVTIRLPIMAR